MHPLVVVYGGLAVLGLVLPWRYNLQFMEAHNGFSLSPFVAEAFSTPAGGSLSIDLVIGSTAVLIWMVVEARRLGMRHVWIYLVLTFMVAFACACPLFLMMRQLHLNRRDATA